MSIFQCQICGCAENTSCGDYHMVYSYNRYMKDYNEKEAKGIELNASEQKAFSALKSYLEHFGTDPKSENPFVEMCAECSPVWFDPADRNYGIGVPEPGSVPRRRDETGYRQWHNMFKKMYLPKGEFITGNDGNLWHKETEVPTFLWAIENRERLMDLNHHLDKKYWEKYFANSEKWKADWKGKMKDQFREKR